MRAVSNTSPLCNLAIIGRLRAEAGFFVDAEIEQFILSQAGE